MTSGGNWPSVPLAELAASTKGAIVGGPFGSDLVANDYVSEGVPVVRGRNLPKAERFSYDNLVYVSEAKADALHLNCARPGDLVFTQRGTLGQVGVIPDDSPYPRFLISQSQMKMTVDPAKAEPLYLYYYFRLPATVANIENHALQAGVPHINLGILRKLQVLAPPRAVQRKIAAILSAYDDLIANNQRRIALLESMAEEIYREWFVRMRFPGHETTPFEKGLPHGWRVCAVSEVLTEQKSPIKRSNLSSVERYVGLEHIPRKSIALNDWGSPGAVESDKLRFAVGDILFGKIRPYLHKVALASFDGACSTDTIVLRPNSPEVRAFGLFTVFSTTFIDFATTASKGTKMPRADWHYLKCLEIRMPSRALLQRFEKTTDPMLAEIGCLLKVNRQLSVQRDALLPRLISGKLKVDHLDIQLPPSMREKVTA